MSRIDELIERLCPDGVEYKPLGEMGAFSRGTSFQKKHFQEEGYPCIHYGQIYTHYGLWADKTKSFLDKEFYSVKGKAKCGDLVIATTSENEEDVCKAMAWLGTEDVIVSNDAYIYHHSMNPKYVAYFFQSEHFQSAKRTYITGTKVLRVSGDSMSKIRIPVPPMEVQDEIVRVLDRFDALVHDISCGLPAEIDARRKQYEYYRDKLLTFKERAS